MPQQSGNLYVSTDGPTNLLTMEMLLHLKNDLGIKQK